MVVFCIVLTVRVSLHKIILCAPFGRSALNCGIKVHKTAQNASYQRIRKLKAASEGPVLFGFHAKKYLISKFCPHLSCPNYRLIPGALVNPTQVYSVRYTLVRFRNDTESDECSRANERVLKLDRRQIAVV